MSDNGQAIRPTPAVPSRVVDPVFDIDALLEGQAESLRKHLGAMDSEDLLRIAGELDALRQTPGWRTLLELHAIQKRHVERVAVSGAINSIGRGRVLSPNEQGAISHAAGVARGLALASQIIDKTLKLAVQVRDELGLDGEG